jgi:DeoR/GlpR family transcriptional regulator of sugar metabolism
MSSNIRNFMLTSERKQAILGRIRQEGRLVAKQFAAELGLSEDTIRRDLRELAAEGLLERVHGGALPIAPKLPDFVERKDIATAEKRALAARAVRLIPPRALVFFDGGTTNEALVAALPKGISLRVATHSPTIAVAMAACPNIDVWLIGGRLYRHSMVAVGAAAAEAIGRLRPDLFFLGATAVHPGAGLTTGDPEEAAIKRLIASQARETFVMVTTAKLDLVSPHAILPLDRIRGMIVSADTCVDVRARYHAAGVDVIPADQP